MSYGGLGLNLPCLLHVLWWVFLSINHFIYTEEYQTEIQDKGPNVEVSKNPSPKTSVREKKECSIAQFTLSTMHTCVKTSDWVCHTIQCKFKNSPNKDNDIHSQDYCKD